MKICFVTGSRAEYGILYPLLTAIKDDDFFSLQLIATAMHLSPEFGLTVDEILQDGFKVDKKIEILVSSDTGIGIGKSSALGQISFVEAFTELAPDLIFLVGDRFEILAAATAALFCRIPIAHYAGGDLTEGSLDDSIRHCITKLSHLHFTLTENSKQRVIQMGEHPHRVFHVGSLAIDRLLAGNFIEKSSIFEELGLDLQKPLILVTFHPVTTDQGRSKEYVLELLSALNTFQKKILTQIVFTKSNADSEGRSLNRMIEDFVKENQSSRLMCASLGQQRYFSLMKYARAVIGNSSSGIIETPSFKIPTVNIGNRQTGRVFASSVITTEYDHASIVAGLELAFDQEFNHKIAQTKNPFGEGNSSKLIVQVLKDFSKAELLKILHKKFFDR